MSEKTDFGRFGKAFQESLCQLILLDRPFSDQISEVLDLNFLELKYLQVFVKKIFEYRQKYSVHPTTKIMITLLRVELDEENEAVQKQIRDYFGRIFNAEVEGSEYIKNTALDFCRKQKLKEAMLRSVGLLQTASFDEISKEINDALKLGASNNYGYDYLKDFEQRFEIKSRNPISTGWKEVDAVSKGGLGKGELGVVIAPTGAGKSMVLVHLGAQAVKSGKTVIHYTLELSDTIIGTRYDSCITGVPLNDVYSFKENIYEKVSELEGSLIIKEYPTKSATTNSIKMHLERLKTRGIEPDMIVVDYADLLRPISNLREKRHELETIYEQLRGLAQEAECPVWTASQTNRSGLNTEVITMESISEAFNKCFVSDFIFSVSRTADDKVANTGRMFIAKNRNGPDGIIYPMMMDTSNVKIKVLQQISREEVELSMRSQADSLREKYKKFKDKGTN